LCKSEGKAHGQALGMLKEFCRSGDVREWENNLEAVVSLDKGDILLPEYFSINQEEEGTVSGREFEDSYTKLFSELITPLWDELRGGHQGRIYDELTGSLEKALISLTLKRLKSNQVKAAKLLGISRNTLRDRIKKHGLY